MLINNQQPVLLTPEVDQDTTAQLPTRTGGYVEPPGPKMPDDLADTLSDVLATTFNAPELKNILRQELSDTGRAQLWEDNKDYIATTQRTAANTERVANILDDATIVDKETEIEAQFIPENGNPPIDPLLEAVITRVADDDPTYVWLQNIVIDYENNIAENKRRLIEEIKANSSGGAAEGGTAEQVGMIAQSLIPLIDRFFPVAELGFHEALGTEKGITALLTDWSVSSISVQRAIRKKYLSLPPGEARWDYMKKLVNLQWDNVSPNASDFSKRALLLQIFNDDLLRHGKIEGWEEILDDVIAVVDVVTLGLVSSLIKNIRIGKGLKSIPPHPELPYQPIPRRGASTTTRGPDLPSNMALIRRAAAPQTVNAQQAEIILRAQANKAVTKAEAGLEGTHIPPGGIPLNRRTGGVIPLAAAIAASRSIFGKAMGRSGTSQQLIPIEHNMSRTDFQKAQEEIAKGLIREDVDRIGGQIEPLLEDVQKSLVGVLEETDLNRFYRNTQKDIQVHQEGGVIFTKMSRFERFDDGTGHRGYITVGANEDGGYGTLLSAVEQVDALVKQGIDPNNISIYKVEGSNIVPHKEGKVALQDLAKELKSQSREVPVTDLGEFYVRFEEDYFSLPLDRGYTQNIIEGPPQIPRGKGWFMPPSSYIKKLVQNTLSVRADHKASFDWLMKAIINPIAKLSKQSQRNVGNAVAWSDQFAQKNKRAPDLYDLQIAFPEITGNEVHGWWLYGKLQDYAYEATGERLHRQMKAQGQVTLRTNSTTPFQARYHGKPLDQKTVIGQEGYKGSVDAFNPDQNKIQKLGQGDIDKLYDSGGTILKMDLEEFRGARQTDLIVYDPAAGNLQLGPLARNPLHKEPSYYTLIYEGPYFVEIIQAGTLNGRPRPVSTVAYTSPNRFDAQKFVDKMNERAARGEPRLRGKTYRVKEDVRASGKTGVAIDNDLLQQQQRLMFDSRNKARLRSTQGGLATMVDPMNAIQTQLRILKDHVSINEYLDSVGAALKRDNAEFLGNTSVEKIFSEGVRAELMDLYSASVGPAKLQLGELLDSIDYIAVLKGAADETNKHAYIKRGAMWLAESLQETLKGIKPLEPALAHLVKQSAKVDIMQAGRSLSFAVFIQGAPVRQLYLQTFQHLTNIPVIKAYALGPLQRDMIAMQMLYTRRTTELLSGKAISDTTVELAAKSMGLPKEEALHLLDELIKSGLIPKVSDVRGTYVNAGGGTTQTSLAKSKVGDITQATGRVIRAAGPREWMQDIGFNSGEINNVVASWLSAVDVQRKATPTIPFTKWTPDVWKKVNAYGRQLAGGMTEVNMAKFQRGWGANMMQYVSFPHKMLMVMMRGGIPKWVTKPIPQLKGVDEFMMAAGNPNYTPQEAWRVTLLWVAAYGTYGFSAGEEGRRWCQNAGFPDWACDIVAAGLFDAAMDDLASFIAQVTTGNPDEEVNMSWSRSVAPMSGFSTMIEDLVGGIFSKPIPEQFAGASGVSGSRAGDSMIEANRLMFQSPERSIEERVVGAITHLAAGGSKGVSDYMKYSAMRNIGTAIDNRGLAIPDVPVTNIEGWIASLTGIQPEAVTKDQYIKYQISRDQSRMNEDIDDYFDYVMVQLRRRNDGEITYDDWYKEGQHAIDYIEMAIDEDDKAYWTERLGYKFNQGVPEGRSAREMIAEYYNRYGEHETYLDYALAKNGYSDDPSKHTTITKVKEWFKDWMSESDDQEN